MLGNLVIMVWYNEINMVIVLGSGYCDWEINLGIMCVGFGYLGSIIVGYLV